MQITTAAQLFLILIGFSSGQAVFGATVDSLNQVSLRYDWRGDTESRSTVVLAWDISKKVCTIKLPKQPEQNLELSKCQSIHDQLAGSWAEFKLRGEHGLTAQARMAIESGDVPLAEIAVGKLKVGVFRSSARVCDTEMQNCHASSTDPVDELGFAISSLINTLP